MLASERSTVIKIKMAKMHFIHISSLKPSADGRGKLRSPQKWLMRSRETLCRPLSFLKLHPESRAKSHSNLF